MDEITSTEKLLDVVRGKSGGMPADMPPPGAGAPSAPRYAQAAPPGKSNSSGTVTVGVDIGHDCLRLVKATRSSDGRPNIIDSRLSPFPVQISKDSAEFPDFLRSELDVFCGLKKGPDIWVMMSAADVDISHIQIPNVSRKQVENAVYWTVKKKSPFDEKETFLDFEILGEVRDESGSKLSVMAYTAPIREVERIKGLFAAIGLPPRGITTAPFAIQNIFQTGLLPMPEEPVAHIYIGVDFSRIDIYAGGRLMMTRGIKSGTNSMVESIMDAMHAAGAGAVDHNEAEKIFFSLNPDIPESERVAGRKREDIFDMILPALERLVKQVERTFEYYFTISEKRVNKIYISSVMNLYKPMSEYIGKQLGFENEAEMLDIGAAGAAALKGATLSERSAFIPAAGLALSDNSYTPNLLFTYKDREKAATVSRTNVGTFVAFMSIVSVCALIYFYQGYALAKKKTVIAGLQKELSLNTPLVDRNMVTQLVAGVKERNRAVMSRYMGMGLINELSALTPSSIRLTGVKIELGGVLPGYRGKESATATAENLRVDGVVTRERSAAEAALSGYMMKLDGSPVFNQIKVQSSSYEEQKEGQKGASRLRFTLSMKVR